MPYNTNDMMRAFRAIYAEPIGEIVRAPDSDTFGIAATSGVVGTTIDTDYLIRTLYAATGITPMNQGTYGYMKAEQEQSTLVVPDWIDDSSLKFEEEWI